MSKILIAMPAFNEESYIGTMVLECNRYGDVIVFNDGSNDQTSKVARLAGATVIDAERNMGIGATIQSILDYTRLIEFDVLVILDSDTQHNPDDIPNMVKPILAGYDLVVGCRNKKQIPRYRLVGQKILSIFTHVITDGKVSDTQSGFRAYSPKAVRMIEIKEKGMAWASEMITVATQNGLRITEVPISVKYTKDGNTFNPVAQGIDSLNRILMMISKRKPLLFFGIAGFTMTSLGLFFGIMGYQDFMKHQVLPIGTILIAVLLLIVGILTIFTGIILNAVRRD